MVGFGIGGDDGIGIEFVGIEIAAADETDEVEIDVISVIDDLFLGVEFRNLYAKLVN